MPFTLTQLRHFVAVAEDGQVSRAAERCNIAQPSLSSSLRNLEDLLGTTLFTRQPRGLRLTPSGERLLRHARHILSAASAAVEDVQIEPNPVRGTVRIAIAETLSGFLVPPLLQQAAQDLPAVAIEIEELEREPAEEKTLGGQIDLAIMIVSHLSERERIAYDMLLQSPRQIWTCFEHDLLQRDIVSIRDLAEYDFILLETDEHAALVKQYWAAHDFKPNIVFRSKSLECIRNLVGQGLGITILSDVIYRAWSHDGGRIRRKPLPAGMPALDIGIGHSAPAAALPPAVQWVKALVKRLPFATGQA